MNKQDKILIKKVSTRINRVFQNIEKINIYIDKHLSDFDVLNFGLLIDVIEEEFLIIKEKLEQMKY